MEGKNRLKLHPINCDIKLIADFFEVDERTIQNWVKKGMPKNGRGEYELIGCVQWKLKENEVEIEILKEGGGDETLRELRKRNVEADLKIKEEKIKVIRGEKLDVELVSVAWKNEMLLIKKILNGMPGVAMIKLEGAETSEQNQRIIQDIVDGSLKQLAGLDPFEDEKEIIKQLEDYDIKMSGE